MYWTVLLIAAGVGFGLSTDVTPKNTPAYPQNCTIAKPRIHQLPPGELLGLKIYECTELGRTCSSDDDCRAPDPKQCNNPERNEDCEKSFAIAEKSHSSYRGQVLGQMQKNGCKAVTRPQRAACYAGACRLKNQNVGAKCDCLQGCNFETRKGLFLSCVGADGEPALVDAAGQGSGICKASPCAPCGEKPSSGGCCAPGVKGHDGNCFCATGVGEGCAVNPRKCNDYANGVCCGKGTKNEGRCCNSGTCNGSCGTTIA